MPAISVIVPVYKVEPFLRRCVDSILDQTFSDYELILVDDGSPDRCGEICEEYAGAHPRIHALHQENGGLSAARNTGIDWAFANSGSQWLAFVDSDDWIAPDYLEQLFRAVTETGCKISACNLYRTSGDPLPMGQSQPASVMAAEDYYCSEQVHDGVTMVAWNKLYHKSLFAALRYPKGKLHEDEFTTYLAVYQAGRVAVIEDRLYAYYQNPTGIMLSKWSPRRLHILEAVEQQIDFAQQNQYPKLLLKAVEHYIYSIHDQLRSAQSEPEFESVLPTLRKKLRHGLRLGRACKIFPLSQRTLWAYEEAYPCKPLWWLISKVR